jgi:hypothetical protein
VATSTIDGYSGIDDGDRSTIDDDSFAGNDDVYLYQVGRGRTMFTNCVRLKLAGTSTRDLRRDRPKVARNRQGAPQVVV